MEYIETTYKEILPELKEILPMFYKEVDTYPENPTPDIDHEAFLIFPDLQVIAARVDDKLVGFHIASVQNDIFYKTVLTGYVLFYYMLPEHRGNGKGTGMFKFAEKLYKDKGIKRVFMSRKIYIPNEKMFESLEYTHIESNYTKAIQ